MISLLYPLLIAYANAVAALDATALEGSATAKAELPPFSARYRASYKSKWIGQGGFELRAAEDGYHLKYWMRAERGMAGAIGLSFAEESRMAFDNGAVLPLDMRHDSKRFISRDLWQAQFAADSAESTAYITGEYNGKPFHLSSTVGVLDPLTQIIDSAFRLAAGQDAWRGTALVRNELREYFFTVGRSEVLVTPCALFHAQRIRRTRAASQAAREIWQQPALFPVPLRIDTIRRNGDTLKLELIRLERAGKVICDAAGKPGL